MRRDPPRRAYSKASRNVGGLRTGSDVVLDFAVTAPIIDRIGVTPYAR